MISIHRDRQTIYPCAPWRYALRGEYRLGSDVTVVFRFVLAAGIERLNPFEKMGLRPRLRAKGQSMYVAEGSQPRHGRAVPMARISITSSLSDLETNLNKTASKVPQSQSNHFAANFEVILEPIDRFEGLSPTGS